ncbi:MAG: FIG00031715: Predicted metal-dependent phosphoesterases (PHP family) [uncultured Gemmatimonadaceae bacterium]|uniref:FIG00031715: Predicted metal-dependent phosphoesterases (PHP family) n=1 Tax=uncultured Gemmatimonadaceae bacterium TaxID=246130 RepID=A0A6J4MKF2_9BACT|nr:MAG: FIG00031715: Predicted metal-dependent phosphoesterases (PHP family) [uncultured Gemmatimonadaceae bacterium]
MTAPAARDAAPADRLVDLHSHSTASDGALPPTAVVEAAAAAGLAALALTDHDTMAGVAEAQAAGARLGVRIVPGVELSALHLEREIHMLALHVERSDELEAQLTEFRAGRVRRAEEMVAKLRGLGAPITMDAVLAHAGRGAVGRPHVARALVDSGFVRDQREAFDRYIGNGRPAIVAKEALYAADAIDLVHAAGGIAVFAHPGRDGTRAVIEPLVGYGLDGLEILHPSQSGEDMARLGALAHHFDLVSSGGSDWHGTTDGFRTLGQMRVPYAVLEQQEARADRRRAERRVA